MKNKSTLCVSCTSCILIGWFFYPLDFSFEIPNSFLCVVVFYLTEEKYEHVVQADFTEDNAFSQPWEGSDISIVVEGQRFHVHSLILTLNSPVFKAMLISNFKEAKSGEITLPEKNAKKVLDFVKQLYVHKREEITSK